AQDLEAHRSGVLALEQIDVLDSIIRPLGNAVLVSLRVRFTGTYYGEKFSEKLAFTRVWSRTAEAWAVTLAPCSSTTLQTKAEYRPAKLRSVRPRAFENAYP
ncbi:nuclear transport factor 2 family protein, partial [Mycobacterium tuberculosis]|nr:nuclear transport factor 2 family protein [Mycobacterium tuberculosis]